VTLILWDVVFCVTERKISEKLQNMYKYWGLCTVYRILIWLLYHLFVALNFDSEARQALEMNFF